jgi:outer membrane usher protein FimD/PapC
VKFKICCLLSCCGFWHADALSSSELDVGYDSRYISEGRNNLPEGGIAWASLSHALNDNVTLGSAYGVATKKSANYDELNLSISYQNSINELSYSLSYTRLEFFEDDESDNEIGLDLSWEQFDAFTPFANAVYSTEAGGSFASLGIESNYEVSESVNISPYASLSFDYGYAAQGNNSYNHADLGANIGFALSESHAINLQIQQSIGGSFLKEDLEQQHNHFLLGLHFIAGF